MTAAWLNLARAHMKHLQSRDGSTGGGGGGGGVGGVSREHPQLGFMKHLQKRTLIVVWLKKHVAGNWGNSEFLYMFAFIVFLANHLVSYIFDFLSHKHLIFKNIIFGQRFPLLVISVFNFLTIIIKPRNLKTVLNVL